MNRTNGLSLTSTVAAIRDQISADLADEVAILNLKSGFYFGLNPVGTSIWKLIQEPTQVAEVRDALIREYDVDPARCEEDLLNLLQKMKDHDLVDIRDEEPAQISWS